MTTTEHGDDNEARALALILARALPLLIKLGDYIGNDGGRCEVIGDIRDALDRRQVRATTSESDKLGTEKKALSRFLRRVGERQ